MPLGCIGAWAGVHRRRVVSCSARGRGAARCRRRTSSAGKSPLPVLGLLIRDEAVKTYDGEFPWLAGGFENLLRMANMKSLAAAVRPSTRRKGLIAVVAGEAPEPGDPTGEDPASGEEPSSPAEEPSSPAEEPATEPASDEPSDVESGETASGL